MSYLRPSPSSANATWQGALPYTRPAAGAADASFPAETYEGTAAATLEITAAAAGTFSVVEPVTGNGAALVDIVAASSAAHGVSGSAASTLDSAAAGAGAHGVAGAAASTFTLEPAVAAVHERYEVRGEVRQGGILVNRRVRVHRRDTGALVAEADTVIGRFGIHCGFVSREHYIVPVDLASDATDWTPPVANRVESVLAEDA